MKTIYTIYCVLMTLVALGTPASADMLGDVNNDGMITTADSLLALRMAVGSVSPDLVHADVNNDGVVNSLDARMILAMAQKTQVRVTAPEVVSGAFEVTIDVYNIADLDSGQFDLSFDPSVVNVTAVHNGDISGRQVPVESWDFVDTDTIRVLFNLPGVTGVSGQGRIATINFETTGSQGDTIVLDISDGRLFDTGAEEIPAIWNGRRVAIGVSVAVNAPEVVTDAFEVTIDIENVTDLNCGQLDLTFDPGVVNAIDVGAGDIDGTTVPIVGWAFVDTDRIRVLFDLPGLGVVSGSGCVARIDFSITGSEGDASVLTISDGLLVVLVDDRSEEIPANWVGDRVTIGELTPLPPTQVRVRNIDTGENFSSIQSAIDDPDTLGGHLIEVGDGVCYENVKVTRSLTIRSLNGSANCVVRAAKSNDAVFDVTADYVKISGFTVKGATGWRKAGVCIDASHCNVSGNDCSDNCCGISITGSNNTVSNNNCSSNNVGGISISDSGNNTLSNNNCSSNDFVGINLRNSSDNIVSNNILSNNSDGMFIGGSNNIISNNTCSENDNGLYLFGPDSVGNIIRNNTIRSNNGTGIRFRYSSCNDFHLNNVDSNGCGICPGSSSNLVYLNNFVNNSENVRPLTGRTVWNSSPKINYTYSDSSYTNYMGNHWSDYNGADVDGDGLGDTPYIITGMNNDTRPLMEPFESYHFRLISDVGVQEVYNPDTGENYFTPEESRAQVCVNAPEIVSDAFNATIDISNVADLDYGQFDLTFDPGVVDVTAVYDGRISGEQAPIDSWEFIGADTITVMFNPPGTAGLRGKGRIATISFEVTGSQGDTSVLDISDGTLTDMVADEIPAVWNDSNVTVGVPVTVSAPEIVSGVFNATIEIENVTDLHGGQFDLSFDPDVVNVTGANAGNIDGTTVPIVDWRFTDADTIRVIFKLSGDDCVSGSGYVARVDFEITGSQGDDSVLDLLDGVLVDTAGAEMPAIWNECKVTPGVPVNVNAPPVVSGAFEVTIDIENVTNLGCGQFDLWFDSSIVNVTGVSAENISGTAVPIDMWVFGFGSDESIRVLFNLPGFTGVSGSGQIATISFETTGSEGYSVLDISDGLLVDGRSEEIPAIWTCGMVTIGEQRRYDQ